MNLDNFNSLIELFFYQSEKQNPKSIFLEWLNPKNKKAFRDRGSGFRIIVLQFIGQLAQNLYRTCTELAHEGIKINLVAYLII